MDIKESDRKRAQKIIDGYFLYDEGIGNKLHTYIRQCKEVYSKKKLSQIDIELLKQCIEYLYDNSTVDDIVFLSTIYLEENRDKEALKLVNSNRIIDERKKEDKQVLLEMYYEIKRYMNIKQVLYRNDEIEKDNWRSLGITETDYIKLKSKTKFEFSILKCCEQLLENKRAEKTKNAEKEKTIELHNTVVSQREIANSQSTVSKQMKKLKKEGEIQDRKRTIKEENKEKISQEEEKIIELYNAEKTQKEIAEVIGKDKASVSRKIKKLKEEGKIRSRKNEEEKTIIEMYNAGKTQKEIAEVIGKTQVSVSDKIHKLKEEGKIEDRKNEEEKTIIEMYNAGKTQKEIAEEIKRHPKSVLRKIKKLKKEGKIQDRKNEEKKIIIEMYNAGKTQEEIAEVIKKKRSSVPYKIQKLKEEGKIQDRKLSKNQNIVEETKEESTENDERIAKKDNDEKASYVSDVKKIIDLLKEDRLLTYVKMQSFDETIRKNAIQRMDSIEILIDDLRKCMKYIDSDDENKKAKAEEFIKRICEKYRALEEKEKQIKQARKMQLGGR